MCYFSDFDKQIKFNYIVAFFSILLMLTREFDINKNIILKNEDNTNYVKLSCFSQNNTPVCTLNNVF